MTDDLLVAMQDGNKHLLLHATTKANTFTPVLIIQELFILFIAVWVSF